MRQVAGSGQPAGGTPICCNKAAEPRREARADLPARRAAKNGRKIGEAAWIMPEENFPATTVSQRLKLRYCGSLSLPRGSRSMKTRPCAARLVAHPRNRCGDCRASRRAGDASPASSTRSAIQRTGRRECARDPDTETT